MNFRIFFGLAILLLITSCSEEVAFNRMDVINKLEYMKDEFKKLDSTKKKEYKKKLTSIEKDLASLSGDLNDLKKQLGEKKKLEPVEVIELKRTNFDRYVSLQSTVESDQNSMISPKMSGVVTKINVNEGSYVKEGDILIELDNSIQLRRLAQAKNQLSFIETVYKKQKRVWEKKVGSEIDYLKAKNDYENMLDNIKLIKEELDMLQVKAPFNGTVDQVIPKVGEAVSPGFGAVRLVSNSGLQIKVDFAENYITNFKKGDRVDVYIPDAGIDTLNLTINSISNAIDANKRTVTAFINLPSRYSQIKPNMTAITKFNDYSLDSAIVVPLNLVQRSSDDKYIFVAEKNGDGSFKATRRKVETGESYRDLIVVSSGLKEGDMIISTGGSNVREGKLVEIVNN